MEFTAEVIAKLTQKQILNMTFEEKDRLIAARKALETAKEDEFIDWEYDAGLGYPLELVRDGDKIENFVFSNIPQYCARGVIIDGTEYSFVAPEIVAPHYMGQAAVSSYLYSTLRNDIVSVSPKWDGVPLRIGRVTDALNEIVYSVLIVGWDAYLLPPTLACGLFELLRGDTVKCLEGWGDDMSLPLADYSDLGVDTDGVIVVTDKCDYRIKKERTYDLEAKHGQLFDKDGARYGPVAKDVRGIVEVNAKFEVVRHRPDKVVPLTTQQVSQVQRSVVLTGLPQLPTYPDVVVQSGLYYYASKCIRAMFHGELLWTLDAVREWYHEFQLNDTCPYNPQEIFSMLAPYLTTPILEVEEVTVEGQGRVVVCGSRITIYVPKVKSLTYAVFLKYVGTFKRVSLEDLSHKLRAEGYVFTSADFRVLKDLFFRGYDHVPCPPVNYPSYVRPVGVVNPFCGLLEKSDLPYLGCVWDRQYVNVEAGFVILPCRVWRRTSVPPLIQPEDLQNLPRIVSGVDVANCARALNKRIDPLSLQSIVRKAGKEISGPILSFVKPTVKILLEHLNTPRTVKELQNELNVGRAYILDVLQAHPQLFKCVNQRWEKV